jgi:hypothetical protein
VRGSSKHLGDFLDNVGGNLVGGSRGVLGSIREGGGVGRRFRLSLFRRRSRVWVGLSSALFLTQALRTYRRSLQSLRRDLMVDGIGGDFDITRSTLLQDVR